MITINKIKIIAASLLIGIMVSISPAFADGTNSQSGGSIDQAKTLSLDDLKSSLDPKSMSDYSKKQYQTIFGCPGGLFSVSEGNCDTTALGMVLGQFNLIALIMGCIVVFYVIIGGSINTAASGEVLGRQWSSAWLPIRTTMAFGLILPLSTTSPYSPAQMATLYAVTVGDNVATGVVKRLSEKVANRELTAGGQIPKVSQLASISLAGSVFCAANEWNAITANGTSKKNTPLYSLDLDWEVFDKDVPGNVEYAADPSQIDEITFGSTGICGSIDLLNEGAPEAEDTTMSARKARAFSAANALIISELNVYANLEKQMRAEKITSKVIELYRSTPEDLDPEIVKSIEAYKKVISDHIAAFPAKLSTAINNGYGKIDPKEFLDHSVVHYTDINKLLYKMAAYSNAPIDTARSINTSIKNGKWNSCLASMESCKEEVEDPQVAEILAGGSTSTMGVMQLVIESTKGISVTTDDEGKPSALATMEEIEGTDPEKMMDKFGASTKAIILESFGAIGSIGGDDHGSISMDFSFNPMIYLHNVGQSVITAITTFYGVTIAAGVIAGAADGNIMTGWTGVGKGVLAGLELLVGYMSPYILALVAAGMAFIMISLVPIIIGIYGYLSIMIMSIQGVAAAPFAVVLLASPEGQGGTNQTAQRFLLHLTHLFLAPLIFVVGGLASVTLIIVGANIMIYAFIADMNFMGSDSWIVNIFSVFVFIVLLYQMVMRLSNFQLELQTQVMEVLGGGFHRSLGSDLVPNTGNIINQSEKAIGDTTGRAREHAEKISKWAKTKINSPR